MISASLVVPHSIRGTFQKLSFCNSSSHCCPLTRQISFSNNQAPTVIDVTRPIGLNTLDTRLNTKRCVKDLVTAQAVARLTTTYHCCDPIATQARAKITRWGLADWGYPSIWSARFGALLGSLVSLNQTKWRRCTNSFDLLRALSGDSIEFK